MKKAVRMAVAAGMCAALALSAGCQKKTVADDEVQRYAWPLATASPEDTVTQIYAEKFAEEVEKLSDGKMKIQVYPNGTIGGDRELLESCKDGDIPFVIQNTAPQVTFMPDLAVFDIPCRFSTIDEVREKVDDPEFYGILEEVYENGGYKLLGYADQGFRVMSTNKMVESLADFKGQKIRTMENPVDVGIFNAIGAQATPMAYSELFTAIQQGTVDGGENTIANYLSDGFSEVAPYLTLSGHTYNICIILISNEAIEKIPADMRDAFFAACKDGIAQASAMVLQANEDAIETLKANGATITDIDRTALYELCKPLYEEFANDRIPTELVEMVNAAK